MLNQKTPREQMEEFVNFMLGRNKTIEVPTLTLNGEEFVEKVVHIPIAGRPSLKMYVSVPITECSIGKTFNIDENEFQKILDGGS